MDMQAYMPGEAIVRQIDSGLGEYNRQRAGIHQALRWKQPVFFGIYAIIFLAVIIATFGMVSSAGGLPFGIALVAGLVGFLFFYNWVNGPATRLQQSFRDAIIPQAFGFIDGVAYRNKVTPASFPHMPKAAVGSFNRTSFDDLISGTHKGFAFEVFEATLSQKTGKSTVQIFKGLVLAFRLDRPFSGVLVATKTVGGVTKFFRDLFGKGGLVQVESGDPELDTLYEFRSTNPEAARQLMSAGFMRALDVLRDHWPEATGRVAISGADAYVLLPTTRNFFEMPKISVDCDYRQHIQPMVSDIGYLLSIAEEVRKAVEA